MFKIIRYVYQKFATCSKIKQLKILEAGVDKEGDPFIKLENGRIFFGPESTSKERKFYKLFLSSGTRKKLPFQCFQIALDIVIRYMEGNLKWGGPAKEAFYNVKEGDVIAEMGAFRGYYTLYLADKVGTSGKIVAIEPIPSNLKYLEKNIAANKLENVIVVPKGVWNENDHKTFQRKSTDFQSGSIDISYNNSEALSIEVNTLDQILQDTNVDQVDFMLIQLNGAEYEALEGLSKFEPKHLAIAARYDKEERNIAQEIRLLLEARDYTTKTLNRKFVYAQLN
ncbi:methyltransferase, FkbM family [Ekhidna lutea]|uniref:Methyltransferase, FkbM family n=1 Tax=Ekhidna lutea TaxID=447679 RepID=A0A239M1W1_EKHLU|nr:FkbM family methyltransferase [Ekhidna lutea]SNT36088.1 methyltransferase, FkbM family [Ekhidna lutea]